MNKVLVLGKGYLGSEFERQGFEVWGKESSFFQEHTNKRGYFYFYDMLNDYDVVINCISKCNTRWCENKENFDQVMDANARLPKSLSEHCGDHGIKFVHISTGCLYDNDIIENKETDFISAHCNYTVSKWIGELNCNPDKDLILRPRLLFNDELTDKNLLYRMLKFEKFTANKLDSLTSLSCVVEATKALLEAGQTGIYNVAHEGSTTMLGIASWLGLKNLNPSTIEEIREESNIYLVNNVMDISKLKKFYQPTLLDISVKSCYNILNEANKL